MAKKIVKFQNTKQIDSRMGYSEWAETQAPRNAEGEIMEPAEANPDQLDESTNPWHITEDQNEVRGRVERLMEIAKQILTEKQYAVYELLAVRCKPQAYTSKHLGISRGSVQDIWDAARVKLQKAYEART